MLANAVYFICGMIISALLCFIVHFIVETNKEKLEEADPFVHVLERKIYWLSNINLAFNKIKKIFDDNPDKFECLKLKCEEKCYNYNKFYCRYKSIGNKYIIKMNLSAEDVPFFLIEENK